MAGRERGGLAGPSMRYSVSEGTRSRAPRPRGDGAVVGHLWANEGENQTGERSRRGCPKSGCSSGDLGLREVGSAMAPSSRMHGRTIETRVEEEPWQADWLVVRVN